MTVPAPITVTPFADFSGLMSPMRGTTGTGLDAAIDMIGTDYGLNRKVSREDLIEGMSAADGINTLIINAIRATGVANDGTLTASDVYSINGFVRAHFLHTFTVLHGNDEDGVETAYHAVQNDGAVTRLYGQNAMDTVLDGLYHIGFAIVDGRFRNEDGDANASVEDVAFWLSDFLEADLAAGRLASRTADPQFHGSTGTGLDRLVELIVDDVGLQTRLSNTEINAGAQAADGMNRMIIDAIRATGVADDGDLTAIDMHDLNAWIRKNRLAEFTTLHGDDEGNIETGFHRVQGDGATGYIYGERTVDTLADGLYHIGFDIQWGRFVNEDGNANASLEEVADWLTLFLADDLASGALDSGRAPVAPPTTSLVHTARTVTVDNRAGHLELGAPSIFRLADGTFSLTFTADQPDNGEYQVLFSKDGASNAAGDLSVFIHDGYLHVSMQNGTGGGSWIKVDDHPIEAGRAYSLAVSFGRNGLDVYLNGEKVAVDDDFTTGLTTNARSLVIGAGTWGRDAANPTATWNHFDGRIEGFTVYNKALSLFEVQALNRAGPLDQPAPGPAAATGGLPAIYEGTGLDVAVYDRTGNFGSIEDLIAQTTTQANPNHRFVAERIDFGAFENDSTLGSFVGDAGTLTTGAATDMTTIGLRASGFVWLEAGTHLVTVRSDDGFMLRLGGETISSFSGGRGFEPTSQQITVATSGLYALDLFYYENTGGQGLRFEIDGETVGPAHFYRSVADYQAALQAHGVTPAGGLPPRYEGPVGTTNTGLDAIIEAIGTDEGLLNNISAADIAAGAAAANVINGMIIEAIRATGAANDGVITTAEVHDLSDYIRQNHYAAFVAAHGDDENNAETGFHLVQNDGATARLFAENAVNTVFDGLYHIGFETVGDRFANEDGNANARVEDVAFWLNDLLADDLASDKLDNANPTFAVRPVGTTGTGLDRALDLISADYGLNTRLTGEDIAEGMAAADGINRLIVDAIKATGVATDGTLTASDVYSISAWIRQNHYARFEALHGNDENGVETAYHTVQNDGAVTRLFGQNAMDTILDGLYHIGFAIVDGRFRNEDGDANAAVEDVAFWLTEFLRTDLAAGTLANAAVDPQRHGTTGTGLDDFVEMIVDDPGLARNLSHTAINQGAAAADGINRMIVEAIRATGVADDGDLTAIDMHDLNAYIRANHLAAFTALHGDDEGNVETGYHIVQGDGGDDYLFGDKLVDTVGDGLYHIGFEIKWGRFVNEDGNANATVQEVADWLSLLLADDLEAGTLASGRAPVAPSVFANASVYRSPANVTVDARVGHVEVGAPAALRLAEGTFAMTFRADQPDNGDYQVLFSKDGSSNAAGDLTVFVYDGHLYVSMQNGAGGGTWLEVEDVTIEAGKAYDLALTFGRTGLDVWLNGEKVAVDDGFTTGLASNNRALVVGAGTWGRDAANPTSTWNHFDGTISNFTVYNRALNPFEIQGLNVSGDLDEPAPGAVAFAGALPAVYEGTGLDVAVYDRSTNFNGIEDLIAQTTTQANPNTRFVAERVDFGAFNGETTLAQFVGDAGALAAGAVNMQMTAIGMKLTGFIWLDAGTHHLTVRSDDGFMLRLGGETIMSHSGDRGFEPTSQQVDIATAGLYAVELYWHENQGEQGLRLELDGAVMGPQHFWRTVADFQAALAANGAAPAGGLPARYDGPVGTTGTGLDQIIRMIGEDEGLANNVSRAEIAAGAAAANTINGLIIEAIRATGAANDGVITAAEVEGLSDFIRTRRYATFEAAHGDDENNSETGFHLVQNDGATTRLFAENAVNTVFDGLYHIGFETVGDRFANEDGNANARIEDVAFWLNAFLADDLARGTLANAAFNPAVPTGPQGSGTQPNVIATTAATTILAAGAQTLTLAGTALAGFGNSGANTVTGNMLDNLIDGGAGNDSLTGGAGNDTLIGGRGIDLLVGGAGNDEYVVDEATDRIIETTERGSGTDTVVVIGGATRYTLVDGLEHLTANLTTAFVAIGNAVANSIQTGRGADRLVGYAGNDTLDGGAGDDTLQGGEGNDSLDGGTGADDMVGDAGNDRFRVDATGDRVFEAAGGGIDSVYATISYRLGAEVENLYLESPIGLRGTGNAGANRIFGGSGNDTLDGAGGNDTLTGGTGNDTYMVGNAGVAILEAAGGGIDTVVTGLSATLATHVENGTLTGTLNVDLTGNTAGNVLRGNEGSNELSGLAGNDALSGGGGTDSLMGGTGNDTLNGGDGTDYLSGGAGVDLMFGGTGADRFLFAAGDTGTTVATGDVIRDFSRAEGDRIDLRAIDAVAGGADNAFTVVGAFSNVAGQLVITADATRYVVTGDINGDGVADFAFAVMADAALTRNDFLL